MKELGEEEGEILASCELILEVEVQMRIAGLGPLPGLPPPPGFYKHQGSPLSPQEKSEVQGPHTEFNAVNLACLPLNSLTAQPMGSENSLAELSKGHAGWD